MAQSDQTQEKKMRLEEGLPRHHAFRASRFAGVDVRRHLPFEGVRAAERLYMSQG